MLFPLHKTVSTPLLSDSSSYGSSKLTPEAPNIQTSAPLATRVNVIHSDNVRTMTQGDLQDIQCCVRKCILVSVILFAGTVTALVACYMHNS